MQQTERKPRILFVIGSLREGGAEGQLVHLLRGLSSKGWPVALLLLHCEGVRLREVREMDIPIFAARLPRFRPRWNPLPWLFLGPSIMRTAWRVRRWKPDIVHAWLFWAHVYTRLILAMMPRQIRLITSRRQTSSDKNDSRILTRMENMINRRASLVVANSKAGARAALKKEKNLPPVIIVRNGIDMDALDAATPIDLRAEFPELSGHRRIGITVANLLPHKGYKTLLRGFALALRDYPSAGLVCVGADGGLLDKMRRKARDLGIDKHVVFAGARTDVAGLLKGADFAVHASDDEGLPNAVMEYMACGLASVVTDVGGTGELIRNWKEGYLIAPGSPEILAERLVDLMVSPSLCRRFAEAARERVATQFPLPGLIKRHEKIYTAIGRS